MGANRGYSISQADTLEKMGEFGDNYDFIGFDTPGVELQSHMRGSAPNKDLELTR